MTDPIIYVGTHRIKEGALEVARDGSVQMGEYLEANHPRMIHFGIYIDDEAHEMTVIQVHPDQASMLQHLEIARDKIAQAYGFLEGTEKIEIYGSPDGELVDLIGQMAMGAPVRFNQAAAGFSRLTAPVT